DDLALALGVCHSLKPLQKPLPGVHGHQLQPHPPEGADHLLRLVLAHEAVVHEDAHELRPQSPVHQGRRHRGVDAAAQGANGPALADRRPHLGDDLLGKGADGPVAPAAGNVKQEVAQELAAPGRVATSGWHWMPKSLRRRSAMAATGESAVRASTSKPGGAASTTSPWLIQQMSGPPPACSRPRKRSAKSLTNSSVRPNSRFRSEEHTS